MPDSRAPVVVLLPPSTQHGSTPRQSHDAPPPGSGMFASCKPRSNGFAVRTQACADSFGRLRRRGTPRTSSDTWSEPGRRRRQGPKGTGSVYAAAYLFTLRRVAFVYGVWCRLVHATAVGGWWFWRLMFVASSRYGVHYC